ncbi:ABC transporter substrate-binding protein [Paenalcaligenes sp. Me131]|uniref:ABC transporter substrate-binding protein n=1 Tax=Paenalcaligenes sp. Me131 TaxID=3392636 RepID=UPI003D2B418D
MKLRSILVATAASSMLMGMSVGAQADTVKIGGLYILSGSAASYGEFASQGMKMAIDEINSSGGVLGQQMQLLMEDDQGKAATGIQAARKLVYQDNVNALVGIDSSGVALGLVPVMKELKTPLIITHAATPHATGKLCNAYTYRISVNEAQNMRAAAELAAATGKKRWTTIGPDYAFGHESWELFSENLSALSPDVEIMKETAFPRFGAEDFTPFINNIMEQKPDGVLISVWGGDLVNFVRQANNLGFFEQDYEIMFTVGAATEALAALGEQMPEGVWLGTRYWYDSHDTDINKTFVDNYKKLYKTPPSYNAEGAYSAVYAIKAAIEKAGSTKPEDIAVALSGLTINTPAAERTFRVGDNQALIGPTWGRAGPMSGDGVRSLVEIHNFDGAQVSPSLEQTECKV